MNLSGPAVTLYCSSVNSHITSYLVLLRPSLSTYKPEVLFVSLIAFLCPLIKSCSFSKTFSVPLQPPPWPLNSCVHLLQPLISPKLVFPLNTSLIITPSLPHYEPILDPHSPSTPTILFLPPSPSKTPRPSLQAPTLGHLDLALHRASPSPQPGRDYHGDHLGPAS